MQFFFSPISDDFAQAEEPRHSENIWDENHSLYRSTRDVWLVAIL